jgi:hypothetical protein
MKPVNCEHVRASLVDYIEFENIKDGRKNITEHLSSCSKCRGEHEELISLMSNIKNISTPITNQTFFDTLPDKVLKEVRLKRASRSDDNNVVNFFKSSDGNKSNKVAAKLVDSQVNGPARLRLPTRLSKSVFAVAASIAIVISGALLMTKQSPFVHDSLKFQAAIKTNQNLATLVDKFSPIDEASAKFGFSSQSQSNNSFNIGSLYAETLAYVRSRDLEASAKHLDTLFKTLLEQQPVDNSSLVKHSTNQSQKVHLIQVKLANLSNTDEKAIEDILIDLHSSYERYSANLSASDLIYFQVGAWVVDVALAALTDNKQLIGQGDTLNYLLSELPRLNVPKGVTVALTQMRDISAKSEISDRDLKNFYRLTQKLRMLLA